MKIKGQRDVPTIHTEEDLTLREMEENVIELAHFLHVSIEGF